MITTYAGDTSHAANFLDYEPLSRMHVHLNVLPAAQFDVGTAGHWFTLRALSLYDDDGVLAAIRVAYLD